MEEPEDTIDEDADTVVVDVPIPPMTVEILPRAMRLSDGIPLAVTPERPGWGESLLFRLAAALRRHVVAQDLISDLIRR